MQMKKVLLVDDEISFLEILSDTLSKDFEVYTATGVLEALFKATINNENN